MDVVLLQVVTNKHGCGNKHVGRCAAMTGCQQIGERAIDETAPWLNFQLLHGSDISGCKCTSARKTRGALKNASYNASQGVFPVHFMGRLLLEFDKEIAGSIGTTAMVHAD